MLAAYVRRVKKLRYAVILIPAIDKRVTINLIIAHFN